MYLPMRMMIGLILFVGLTAAAVAAPVPQFGEFEASFTLPNQTGNPFDPQDNDIAVTFAGPSRLKAVVPAFWDGDRWRVRYAPSTVGNYSVTVTRGGLPVVPIGLTASNFQCVASSNPGFVRRTARPVQSFVFDNGKPYYPIGMNVAWINRGEPDYPVFFADMDKAHLNWARVWTTYWDGKALEWAPNRRNTPPRGFLSLEAAQRWDMIFDQAAQHGIYVQMVLQHHGQYTERTDPNWRDNPFNVANGGFLQHPDDFFTDPEARRLTKAKFRYIVARWGYSSHLLSYELFNEVQNITETRSHFQDVVNWHKEMAAYIRSIDTQHHLLTTSNSVPGTPLSQIGLDYDQIHTYPRNIVSTFASATAGDLSSPVFYGEWGPPQAPAGQAERLVHDGLWAGLMTPQAGASQYWFWDKVMANDWWSEFASAGGFAKAFTLPLFTALVSDNPAVDASDPVASVAALAKGNSHAEVFWVYTRDRTAASPQDATLRFSHLAPGKYRVQLWETQQGRSRESFTVQSQKGNDLLVQLHNIQGDLAGVIAPQSSPPTF